VTVGIGRRDSNYVGKSWGIFSMFAVDVCRLPETGGSIFVVVAGVFLLIAGVIVTRWVRASAGRMSVMVAPLVLLGGLVLAPSVTDPCVPTTTVTATTTTVAPVVYSLGDTGPSGGIIFYVDRTRAEGSQYFEAACVGWSDGTCGGDDATDPKAQWGCYESPIAGADGLVIGTGAQNTVDIMRDCSALGIAGRLAGALELGGQDDWFLPSKDELNQMYIWRIAIGGFTSDGYWSSSEFSASIAWSQIFLLGGQSDSDKDSVRYVRPVRSF
jgi:hypothetical protein